MNRINFSFFIRTDAINKQGKLPVYLSLSINGSRIKMNLKIFIVTNEWDEAKKKVKSNCSDADEHNRILNDTESRILKIKSDCNEKREHLSISKFKQYFLYTKVDGDFIGYILAKAQQRVSCNDIKLSTNKNYNNTANKLREFKSKIEFDELTPQFIASFWRWLKRKKFSNNYIYTIFKVVKKCYSLLIKETGLINQNIFDDVQVKYQDTDVCHLSIVELKSVILHYDEIRNSMEYHPSYKKTLLYYLFSCFSGLRTSDINRLNKFEVVENTLKFKPQKQQIGKERTRNKPLNEMAMQYWNEIEQMNFPKIADQTKNKMLKLVAQKCNINKPITYHSSRHTAATTLSAMKVEVNHIKEFMDHKNISTTMRYVHLQIENIREAVSVMDAEFKLHDAASSTSIAS